MEWPKVSDCPDTNQDVFCVVLCFVLLDNSSQPVPRISPIECGLLPKLTFSFKISSINYRSNENSFWFNFFILFKTTTQEQLRKHDDTLEFRLPGYRYICNGVLIERV